MTQYVHQTAIINGQFPRLTEGSLLLATALQSAAPFSTTHLVNDDAESAYHLLDEAHDEIYSVLESRNVSDEGLLTMSFLRIVARHNLAVYHFYFSDEDVASSRAAMLFTENIKMLNAVAEGMALYPALMFSSLRSEFQHLYRGTSANLLPVLRLLGRTAEAAEVEASGWATAELE